MEQLVLVGIFLAVSIIDALAKNAKKKKMQEEAERLGWDPEHGMPEADWEVAEAEGGVATAESDAQGSEGLIPRDVWEEIAALAGGRLEREETPEPEPVEVVVREPVSLEVPAPDIERETRQRRLERTRPPLEERGRLRRFQPREHEVHGAHALYGTDPSERPPSEQDGLDPLAQFLGADVAAVRESLNSHDVHKLRQALVLSEVLGPPVTLRDE